MKKLVNSFMANRIYWANILKDGMMGNQRIDVTDDACIAVMQKMKVTYEREGKTKIRVSGLGTIEFSPEIDEQA